MKHIPNVLLVEGSNDKSFFENLCKKYNLNVQVKVKNPRDLLTTQGVFNSKGGVIDSLEELLPLLEDEDSAIKKIAIILDADITGENNGGFKDTMEQIKAKTKKHGYNEKHIYLNKGVEIPHSDKGMNSIGVWIMPDNKSDGTIEDWIKSKILSSETTLFNHACRTVHELTNKKFSQNSIAKAEIATWLAWQNQPGRTIAYALKDGEELLDINHESFKDIITWLKAFFSE